MLPGILDRYLMREVLRTQLAVMIVLLLVIAGGVLARMLREAAEGRIPGDLILPLLAFGTLRGLILLFPISVFVALMLTLGRLYQESEMSALRACGIGHLRLYQAVSWVLLPLLLVSTLLVFWVSPWIVSVMEEMRTEAMQRSELIGITPGRFMMSRTDARVFYIESLSDDRRHMEYVFTQRRDATTTEIVIARQAEQHVDEITGQRFLVLLDGYRYQGSPGSGAYQIISFERYGVRIPESTGGSRRQHRDTLSNRELWQSEDLTLRAEWQWRMSVPLSLILLSMLALPLAHTTPRKGRYAKLAVGILIYVVYANLLILAKSWYADGYTPAWLGMWWVHLLLLVLTIILLARQEGFSWLQKMALRTT